MSIAEKIRDSIKKLPAGKAFTIKRFHRLGTNDNVRKILSRMAKSGQIRRVARGIFAKPKKAPYIGEVLPTSEEIAKTVATASGEIVTVHGAEAARQLKLTTQTPMKAIFYTSGNTRKIEAGKRTIILKHVCPRKLVASGSMLGLVLTALWYLGKKNVSLETITKIKKRLTKQQFYDVMHSTEQMPGWMADVFYQYQQELSDGKELH